MLLPAAAAAAVIALPVPASSAGPTATAAKNCGFSSSLGVMYVNKIRAKRTSCRKAKRLIKAYHKAGAGDRRVKGYRCRDKVLSKGLTQLDARATCKRKGKRVSHIYTKSR